MSTRLLWLVPLLLGSCLILIAQKPDEQTTLSVDVTRVMLYITVRDNKAGIVGDLVKDQFTVLENGKPQKILSFDRDDVPVAIGLLVDNSGSMLNKRGEVIEAAKAFVNATNPADEIFVLHFNEQLTYGLPKDVPFTGDRALLGEALDRVRLTGRTALYDAISEGLRRLRQSTLTKRALIVISDGGDNFSKITDDAVVEQADLIGALFYGIGIYDPHDGDASPGVLRELAKKTGGQAFFPDQLDQVRTICGVIARELRTQYAVAYKPPLESKNDYRKVEVKVKDVLGRKLTVRTRTGYYTKSLFEGGETK